MFDSIWRGLAATIDSRFKGKHMLYEDHGDKVIIFAKPFSDELFWMKSFSRF